MADDLQDADLADLTRGIFRAFGDGDIDEALGFYAADAPFRRGARYRAPVVRAAPSLP
jgi:hypothetical protein